MSLSLTVHIRILLQESLSLSQFLSESKVRIEGVDMYVVEGYPVNSRLNSLVTKEDGICCYIRDNHEVLRSTVVGSNKYLIVVKEEVRVRYVALVVSLALTCSNNVSSQYILTCGQAFKLALSISCSEGGISAPALNEVGDRYITVGVRSALSLPVVMTPSILLSISIPTIETVVHVAVLEVDFVGSKICVECSNEFFIIGSGSNTVVIVSLSLLKDSQEVCSTGCTLNIGRTIESQVGSQLSIVFDRLLSSGNSSIYALSRCIASSNVHIKDCVSLFESHTEFSSNVAVLRSFSVNGCSISDSSTQNSKRILNVTFQRNILEQRPAVRIVCRPVESNRQVAVFTYIAVNHIVSIALIQVSLTVTHVVGITILRCSSPVNDTNLVTVGLEACGYHVVALGGNIVASITIVIRTLVSLNRYSIEAWLQTGYCLPEASCCLPALSSVAVGSSATVTLRLIPGPAVSSVDERVALHGLGAIDG